MVCCGWLFFASVIFFPYHLYSLYRIDPNWLCIGGWAKRKTENGIWRKNGMGPLCSRFGNGLGLGFGFVSFYFSLIWRVVYAAYCLDM
jgi:hypothetical protein